MKQNKKGFTLIELLAVIVILAVIALITTPIILNVVEESRKNAAKDKTYGVIDAVKLAYAQEQMNEGASDNPTYTLDFSKADGKKVGNTSVKISGDIPTEGKVFIDNGNITVKSDFKLKFGNYRCYINDKNKAECNRQ